MYEVAGKEGRRGWLVTRYDDAKKALHKLLELGNDLPLLAVERPDLGAVAVEQLQAQAGRRVVTPAAVAPGKRGQAAPDRLGIGELVAQLERQLTQQLLGLAYQVLAAGQDRPAPVVPQGQQLTLLVRAAISARALERLGQQRVRHDRACSDSGRG